jgi:hypothetical protein
VPPPSDTLDWPQMCFALSRPAVSILGEDEVRDYLAEHPDLFAAAESLCQAARKEFGQEASLSLEVYRDPEVKDRYLVLRVRLPTYPPDTLMKIRSLETDHEGLLEDTSGSILVTTDFCPTR